MKAIKINSCSNSNAWYQKIVGNVMNNVVFENGKYYIQSVFTDYMRKYFDNSDISECEPESGIMASHNQYALLSKCFHH